MASTGLTLFTLPREIRNQIYGYLDKEVTMFYRFRSARYRQYSNIGWSMSVGRAHRSSDTQLFMGSEIETILVRVINAPSLTIQLVHSQLRKEYLESDCIRKSRANFKINPHDWYTRKACSDAQFKTMLSVVRDVTFVAGMISGSLISSIYVDVIKHITRKCKSLRSLRLVVREPLSIFRHKDLDRVLLSRLIDHFPNITELQHEFHRKFALKRCASGFQIGYPKDMDYDSATSQHGLSHQIYRIVVFLYVHEDVALKSYKNDDLRVPVIARRYPQEALRKLLEDERQEVRSITKVVFQWEELKRIEDGTDHKVE